MAQFRCATMREKSQELRAELAEEWRPPSYGWSDDSAAQSSVESEISPPTHLPSSDKKVTICVTKGRSVRTTHRLTKPRASIGSVGGRADMQIDDPGASPLHCAVAITENGVRLYDLDSANGTYVDDEQIHQVNLENRSTFRIGSTEFVVSIIQNHSLDAT
jgi:pSer/pThr/pTyr-binding forkhead associated (FHA) protein